MNKGGVLPCNKEYIWCSIFFCMVLLIYSIISMHVSGGARKKNRRGIGLE